MPIIPALRKLRQEDHEFKVSLGSRVSSIVNVCYIMRPYLKQNLQSRPNQNRTTLVVHLSMEKYIKL
jgi:hypothetical protein